MNDGERQVADTLDGIRRDHVARYEFVADRVRGQNVLDCASGVGYGSWILGGRAEHVDALEVDGEAITYASRHWAAQRVQYHSHDLRTAWESVRQYDAAVAFECIEHLEHPEEFLSWLDAPILYASVPNETVFPYRNYAYHHRHYTAEEFEALLNRCGYEVVEWYGQAGPESELVKDTQGRTQIAVCRKADNPSGGTWRLLPEVPKQPKSVAIVAMGASSFTYLKLAAKSGGRQRVADEIWAINSMGNIIQHDKLFAMDDLKLQEARARERPESNTGGLIEWLRTHPGFFTSTAYPDYPNAIEYPLQKVIKVIGNAYFNSTVAYAVAFAIATGVKSIHLYGCDFAYRDRPEAEKGRACIEFMLGIASQRGVSITVPQDTTLLDANAPGYERFYGYDAWNMTLDNGEVQKTPKPLPSVDEIERRYDKTGKYTEISDGLS